MGIVIYLVCACANIGACACNVGDVKWSGKKDISPWNILAFTVFSFGSSVGNTLFQGANTAIYVKLLPPQYQARKLDGAPRASRWDACLDRFWSFCLSNFWISSIVCSRSSALLWVRSYLSFVFSGFSVGRKCI